MDVEKLALGAIRWAEEMMVGVVRQGDKVKARTMTAGGGGESVLLLQSKL